MDQDDCPDPLIDEIRAIREQIWREHGCDLDRYFAHLMEYQKQFEGRLISRTFTPEEESRFQAGMEKLRSMPSTSGSSDEIMALRRRVNDRVAAAADDFDLHRAGD